MSLSGWDQLGRIAIAAIARLKTVFFYKGIEAITDSTLIANIEFLSMWCSSRKLVQLIGLMPASCHDWLYLGRCQSHQQEGHSSPQLVPLYCQLLAPVTSHPSLHLLGNINLLCLGNAQFRSPLIFASKYRESGLTTAHQIVNARGIRKKELNLDSTCLN